MSGSCLPNILIFGMFVIAVLALQMSLYWEFPWKWEQLDEIGRE